MLECLLHAQHDDAISQVNAEMDAAINQAFKPPTRVTRRRKRKVQSMVEEVLPPRQRSNSEDVSLLVMAVIRCLMYCDSAGIRCSQVSQVG